jgi:nitrogen fixation NifU-like protein
MYELEDLYQELIIDHSKRPRNFHALSGSAQSAEGFNPLCGDKVTIYLKTEGDVRRKVTLSAMSASRAPAAPFPPLPPP